MRIKLDFITVIDRLPLDYRRSLLSFFKYCLQQSDSEKFSDYYNKDACRSKSYSFAVAFPRGTIFHKDHIVLGKCGFSLTFSTGDLSDVILFFNSFMRQKGKAFALPDGNQMTLNQISHVNVPTIVTEEIVVRMLSPLVLRLHSSTDNQDRYVEWSDADFNQTFVDLTAGQIKRLSLNTALEGLHIEPLAPKKTVIAAMGGCFPANLGTYRLSGNAVLLNQLQDYGIGSRRNIGFGLFCVDSGGKEEQY